MKAKRTIIPALLVMLALMTVMTGCKYDVKQPLWEQPYTYPAATTIDRMDPDSATAGVNTIKIIGTNFASTMDSNKVYFEKTQAEILNASSTQIEVRRPNLVSDTVHVKVVSYNAAIVAKFFPYKITSVWQKFGGFIENKLYNVMAADPSGNVYVINPDPRNIYKVEPNGNKTSLGIAPRVVTDAQIAPDGNLVLMSNFRTLYKVNTVSGDTSTWVGLGSKKASYGDFDAYGNFWCGASKTDLILVKPDKSNKAMGLYLKDAINQVKVANGSLYLMVVFGTAPTGYSKTGIWRHPILDGDGNLGPAQIVLDWPSTGMFASSDSVSFAFSNDNKMYVGSKAPQVMVVDLTTGQQDILYKDILPAWSPKLVWGAGSDMFMLVAGSEKYLVKIAMGKSSAPK